MSPREKIIAFRPDDDIQSAMVMLWERDGISYSEQIRRALRVWLEEKEVLKKTARKRVQPRKQA